MKKRHLLFSLMTLVLCLTLISGATFALFTNGLEAFNKAYKDGTFNMLYTTNPELKFHMFMPGERYIIQK